MRWCGDAQQNPVTMKFLAENEIVQYDLLSDYHPLEMIGPRDSFFILHHYS